MGFAIFLLTAFIAENSKNFQIYLKTACFCKDFAKISML